MNDSDLGDFGPPRPKKVKLAKRPKQTHALWKSSTSAFPRGQQGGHVARDVRNATRHNGGGAKGELIWMNSKLEINTYKSKAQTSNWKYNVKQGKSGMISAKNGEIRNAHTHSAEGEIVRGKCSAQNERTHTVSIRVRTNTNAQWLPLIGFGKFPSGTHQNKTKSLNEKKFDSSRGQQNTHTHLLSQINKSREKALQ